MEHLLVGLGGMLGALARYRVNKWAAKRWEYGFPWGTLMINVSGSFVLGILFGFLVNPKFSLTFMQPFAATGLLGAFTTYSTFSFEFITLYNEGQPGTAFKYLAASLVLGIGAAYLGVTLAGFYFFGPSL